MGRLHGAFGVRGDVKRESYADPLRAIARYQPWTLRDARGNQRLCEGAKVRELGGVDAVGDGYLAQHTPIAGLAAIQDQVGDELTDPRLRGGLLDVAGGSAGYVVKEDLLDQLLSGDPAHV